MLTRPVRSPTPLDTPTPAPSSAHTTALAVPSSLRAIRSRTDLRASKADNNPLVRRQLIKTRSMPPGPSRLRSQVSADATEIERRTIEEDLGEIEAFDVVQRQNSSRGFDSDSLLLSDSDATSPVGARLRARVTSPTSSDDDNNSSLSRPIAINRELSLHLTDDLSATKGSEFDHLARELRAEFERITHRGSPASKRLGNNLEERGGAGRRVFGDIGNVVSQMLPLPAKRPPLVRSVSQPQGPAPSLPNTKAALFRSQPSTSAPPAHINTRTSGQQVVVPTSSQRPTGTTKRELQVPDVTGLTECLASPEKARGHRTISSTGSGRTGALSRSISLGFCCAKVERIR
jgi:hypothetical protein